MVSLEKQKSKLEDTKRKLKQREKMIQRKEKISVQNALYDLGRLFVKTNTAHLDHQILLGALLDISEKSKDENFVTHWREKSQLLLGDHNKGNAITISFKNPPPIEIRDKLKEINFKWNSFRGEYYGFGDKNALSKLLENHVCQIEIINATK